MNLILRIFQFSIFSNILVAICAVCLCMSSQIMTGINNNSISFFVLFSTLATYNFQRIIRIKEGLNNIRRTWMIQYKSTIYFLVLILSLISIYYFIHFNLKTQISIVIASIIALLYPFGLRKIPFFKIFFISFVWTIMTSLILFLENNIAIKQEEILHLASRFLFVFAITIPFDIRDMYLDNQKFKTIPILIGERKSKIVSLFSLILAIIIYLQLFYQNNLSANHLIGIIIALLITSVIISQAHHKRKEKYFSFWIESTSIMLYLILSLSSWIV